jgi:hypothetical protein
MGIGNFRCSARGEQPADIGGVHPAEVDHVGCRLPDQARQPGLSLRPPDRLGRVAPFADAAGWSPGVGGWPG